MRNKYNSQHLLLFVVTSLIGILMVYGIVTKVMSWFKSKQMSQSGQKCRELEHELILESSFKDSTIVDVSFTDRILLWRCFGDESLSLAPKL